MGQKVHPESLRVGYIHDWKSNWFNERAFADFLHEDTRIRDHITGRLSHDFSSLKVTFPGPQTLTFVSPLTPAPKHFSSATLTRSYGASFALAKSSTMRGRSARVAVRITAKDYTTARFRCVVA